MQFPSRHVVSLPRAGFTLPRAGSSLPNRELTMFRHSALWLPALWIALLARSVLAGGGPENVFLVVNSSSWASQAVANEFIHLRQIPAGNVFYIAWDGGFEGTPIAEFRERILLPTLKTIEQRGLDGQIDYVVYSSDFPYRIDAHEDLQGQATPQQLTPGCSLNSATYLWQHALLKSPTLLGLRNNQYFVGGAGRPEQARAFKAWYGWGPQGELLESGGTHYLLSTMLAMTSGRGNSVPEALAYLNRSAKADGTHPAGSIYYMQNDDVRSKTRAGGFAAAVANLKELGVQATVAKGDIPTGRPDVQGLQAGIAEFNWRKSGSTILPGAICDNLTSFGGVMSEQAGQTPLADVLRYGAAGASGTVVEPYAIQDKFPTPAIQVYYASGCSLAESFYQSVFGPYQLLIVGDPLCRPWANIPQVHAQGIEPGARLKGQVELRVSAKFAPADKLPGGDRVGKADRFELFVDGKRLLRVAEGVLLALDTRKFADGYHELRAVAIEAGPIETQGRTILPITIDNQGRSIEFSAQPAGKVRWDQELTLQAKAPGSEGVVFFHNGRLLGRFVGAQGEIKIKPQLLGTGPVTLRAIGLSRGGPLDHVMATPIDLVVEPAKPLAGTKQPVSGNLVRGMQLKIGSAAAVPVHETIKPEWLSEAGVKPGDAFTLDGYFDVGRTEIYQFQLWHHGELQLSVDGVTLFEADKGDYKQRFVPVALAAGLHRLVIQGKAASNVHLRVLFGGPGSRALDGITFRHPGG